MNDDKDKLERIEKVLKKSRKKSDRHLIAKAFALVTQLGLQTACCVVIGVFLGIFLDGLFGTMPVFIIIFSILGSAASIKIIFDISKDWKD